MNNITFSRKILRRLYATLVLTGFSAATLSAQIFFYNNGAQIYTGTTAIIKINGSFQNDGLSGATPVFENNGTMTISNSGNPGSVFLTHGSTLQGNGTYFVEQDWTNDAAFSADNSTVNFNGNTQEFITSTNSTVTTFNNLLLTGTGIGNNRKKTLHINAKVGANGALVINDRELETLTNTMFVLNPSPVSVSNNAISNPPGFVSSSFNTGGSGYLSRITNMATAYVFPTGSSVNTIRYRPVILTPSLGNLNTFTVRLGNNDATNDGFNIASVDTNMCSVNPLYYHEITHPLGSDNASIDILYNLSADGGWDGIAKWNSTAPNIWNNMGTAVMTTNVPFNDVLKVNWADFSNSPYILSRRKPEMPVLACNSVCANSPGNSFTASGSGATYTWTSPTGTTITSGQNTNAVTVNWGPAPGPLTVAAVSQWGCSSRASSCTVNLSASPVAAFSSASTELTYNFSDLSTGTPNEWAWNFGDGAVSNSQNPVHTFAACGPEKICLIAKNGFCVDTLCTDMVIDEKFVVPNIFSPDGDGINDLFYINYACLKEYDLTIFDRWGLKIFETTSGGWDGRNSSGVQMSDGTYYYILKAVSFVGPADYSTKGFISLVRKK